MAETPPTSPPKAIIVATAVAAVVQAWLTAEHEAMALAATARRFAPWKKTDLNITRVDVVPGPVTMDMETRTEDKIGYLIGVIVQRNVDPDDTATAEVLAGIVEDLEWHMRRRNISLANYTYGVRWESSESLQVDAALLEKQRFLGIININYATWYQGPPA